MIENILDKLATRQIRTHNCTFSCKLQPSSKNKSKKNSTTNNSPQDRSATTFGHFAATCNQIKKYIGQTKKYIAVFPLTHCEKLDPELPLFVFPFKQRDLVVFQV